MVKTREALCMDIRYKRVLLKISGEALAGEKGKGYDPETLALMYVSPILVLLGECDRQPQKETECLEKLDAHVGLFFGTFNTQQRKEGKK